MNNGDKIIILRGVVGIISGIISFVLGFMGYFIPGYISALLMYLITIPFVRAVFSPQKVWNMVGKGSLTYVSLWFITWTLLLQLQQPS